MIKSGAGLSLLILKFILEKIKRHLLTILVKFFQTFSWFLKSLKLFFFLLGKLAAFLYQLVFKYPFLIAYQILRRIKRICLSLFALKQPTLPKSFLFHLPLVLLVAAGVLAFGINLRAQGTKSENPGYKSLLFEISAPTDNYWEDEILSEEIEEGPITSQAPSSYLEETTLTPEAAGSEMEKPSEAIGSLISTTQGEAALIAPQITDPTVVTKKRDKVIDYVVQSGDVISTIAAKFGITVNTVLWENNLSSYSLIRPGQTLKILPVSGLTHKIKKGETLKAVAKKYKVNESEIIEFNKLASATDLAIDQVMIIPGGIKPQATPVVAARTTAPLPAIISSSKLQWPTNAYRLTQYFTWRHSGIDIANKTGQPVYAAEAGKVETTGWNRGGYGYYIIVDHGGGFKTLYAHLSQIYIKIGQNVSRGQVIGAVGSTGRSTGPHVHFEVRVRNVRINPLEYLR